MNQNLIKYINREILKQAASLKYSVADLAPSTETDLFNAPSLVVWSGASDATVYQDETVNWAFRAIHDAMHLETGLSFSVEHEIEMGRIQASKQSSSVLADLFFCEIAGQAQYYKQNGVFVSNQVEFTLNYLQKINSSFKK